MLTSKRLNINRLRLFVSKVTSTALWPVNNYKSIKHSFFGVIVCGWHQFISSRNWIIIYFYLSKDEMHSICYKIRPEYRLRLFTKMKIHSLPQVDMKYLPIIKRENIHRTEKNKPQKYLDNIRLDESYRSLVGTVLRCKYTVKIVSISVGNDFIEQQNRSTFFLNRQKFYHTKYKGILHLKHTHTHTNKYIVYNGSDNRLRHCEWINIYFCTVSTMTAVSSSSSSSSRSSNHQQSVFASLHFCKL